MQTSQGSAGKTDENGISRARSITFNRQPTDPMNPITKANIQMNTHYNPPNPILPCLHRGPQKRDLLQIYNMHATLRDKGCPNEDVRD